MRKLIPVFVVVLAFAIPAHAFAATAAVKITGTAFSPKTLTINYGDSVTWTNSDNADHQLVSDNGSFASPIIKPKGTWSHTFATPGTFSYHDALHPSIKGTIKVTGPPPSVTLGAGAPILVYGTPTTLTGTVSNGAANQPVVIMETAYGLAAKQIATVMTGAGGGFSYTVTPSILTTYTATWKTATSQTVTVQVRPKLQLLPYAGRFWAKVTSPVSYAGKYIYLQRRSTFGQWVTVEKLKLGVNSGRIFSLPVFHGTVTFRVYMPLNTAGAGYLDGMSGTQKVHHV